MKLLSVVACYFALPFMTYSQGYYEIKSLGSDYSTEEIQTAFNTANFCGSHLESERFLIVFNDGAEVELLSANEIAGFDPNCILNSGIDIPVCTYSIASGIIMRACDNKLTPFEEKIKTDN